MGNLIQPSFPLVPMKAIDRVYVLCQGLRILNLAFNLSKTYELGNLRAAMRGVSVMAGSQFLCQSDEYEFGIGGSLYFLFLHPLNFPYSTDFLALSMIVLLFCLLK